MKSLTRMVQEQLRLPSQPVYQQMELPLHGIRLRPEEWRVVQSLARMRQTLAAAARS